ncbi:MAG: hypothetical protein P4L51_28495 [Puia sp.]|nr:hypothetical protein [Puia sp.]
MKKLLKISVVMPVTAFLVGVFASAFALPTKMKSTGTTFFISINGGLLTLVIGQTIPGVGWVKVFVTPGPCLSTLSTCYVITSTDNPNGTPEVVERLAGIRL